jgi:hypothetical protein
MTIIRAFNIHSILFIIYPNEANAQFAKEAIAHQPLNHSEILSVQ